MIQRLYVHNFRCLENFELRIGRLPSLLLLGRNGSGKTTVGLALEILQKIARGTNRLDSLVKPKDFAHGRTSVPMRFEIGIELNGEQYTYSIAFELSEGSPGLQVLEEKLAVDGHVVFAREQGQVTLAAHGADPEAKFPIGWHLVALPIIQGQSSANHLFIFKQALARLIILRPVPSLISGDSNSATLEPNAQATDFAAWFSGLMTEFPAAYGSVDSYLRKVIPDLQDIQNRQITKDSRSLVIQFFSDKTTTTVPFEDLADGEKCFMICALVLASRRAYGSLICFWDEPDSYLALPEVGQFISSLRKEFQQGGQFIATSHNPEAIRRFSNENTLFLSRKNHLEPVVVRTLDDLHINGDLVGALIRDDLEP